MSAINEGHDCNNHHGRRHGGTGPHDSGSNRVIAILLAGLAAILGYGVSGTVANEPAKISGPNACAECHKQEVEAWKTSHHYKTFRDLPRNKEAVEIAEKMGVQRLRSEGLCLSCHYTVQLKEETPQPIAGISCESCHGASDSWIKIHSQYSGKTEKTESKAEAQSRWKLAQSKGMIRPSSVYQIAKNCYGCHVTPHEELVNKGGHAAGSTFELVSWSQGEVRHNTWHSKGKDNAVATAARKRMLYVVGLGVDLETGLRAIGKATVRRVYAFQMARRVDRARTQLANVAKAVPSVPEISKIVELAHSAGLKLNNERLLTTAADEIGKVLATISEKYDGSTMAGLDPMIPGPDKYKGAARAAAAAN